MVIAVSEDFTNVSLYVSQVPASQKTRILAILAKQFVLSKLRLLQNRENFGISGTPKDLGPAVGLFIPFPQKDNGFGSGSTKSLLPWVTTRRSRLMPALEAGLVGVNYTKVWCFLDAECVKQESTLHPPTFKYMIKLIGFI